MRIIAGAFGGRRLTPLGKGDEAARLRPTPDRVRESLFSVLSARRDLARAQVLDLFAGTGALGLEALSRGAQAAVFVEQGRKSLALLRKNIALLEVAAQAQIVARDATRLGPATVQAADLVFLDPPYGQGMGALALASAQAGGWITPGALVVWEEAAAQPAPEGFTLLEHRKYGETHLTLLEARDT